MLENIPESVIALIFIIIVLLILYKIGMLKKLSLTTSSGSYVKLGKTLEAKYSILKGPQFFKYFLKKNQRIIFYYDIEVNNGSLKLKMTSKSGDLFDEIFIENEKGSIEITPKTRSHVVELNGRNFRGKCRLRFEEMS